MKNKKYIILVALFVMILLTAVSYGAPGNAKESRLSDMSPSSCIDYVKLKGIKIPEVDKLNNIFDEPDQVHKGDAGTIIKEIFKRIESAPYDTFFNTDKVISEFIDRLRMLEFDNDSRFKEIKSKNKALSQNDALALMMQMLKLNKGLVKFLGTNSITGFYEVKIGENGNYTINPINGDVSDFSGESIINLRNLTNSLSMTAASDKVQNPFETDPAKNADQDFLDIIKKYGEAPAKKKTPSIREVNAFINDIDNSDGIILNNKLYTFKEMGITDRPGAWWGPYFFLDINNDGIDELCNIANVGAGALYDFIDAYKPVQKDSKTGVTKYIPLNLEGDDNQIELGFNEDAPFIFYKNNVYIESYDRNEYKYYYIRNDKAVTVADVTLTYEEIPKSINVSPHNATMDYLRKKYTNAIPFYKEPKNDEMIFDKSCPAYMTMDKSIRDELLNDNGDFHSNDQKRYMIYDIDNDGNSELFMKWVAFVQVRGGSALFDNKYAVFKSKDGIWRLYDTNASTEDNNAKFDDFYNSDNSTAYNIYFLSYAGKVYTIIGGDDSYADGGIYSEKIGSPTGEATVYLNEKGHITKIGTINFTFKTIKHITNQPVSVISTPEYDWEINDLMENYEHLLIYAINNNHFSVLENLLVKDSNLYNSQKSLIKSLYGRKIKEKLVSYNIADIKTTDKKDELKIYVTEQIGIDYGNGKGFVTKTYNWIYTAKMSNYSFRLSDLEKWK